MATLSSIITPTNITTASNTQTLTNKTITGGILNGTLGATTPSTVAATTLSTSGDSSIVASQAFPTTAGRGYLQINGSSSTGVLQMGTKQADADGNLCGLIEAHDINSTSGTTRVGYMAYRLVGATANNRGSTLSIFTKPNGSTGLEMATFSSTGLAITGTLSTTGNAAIGGSVNSGVGLFVQSSVTGSNSGVLSVNGTTTYAANNVGCYGSIFQGIIATGGYTGLTYVNTAVNTPSLSGGGSVTAYQLVIYAAPASAAAKYGLYQIGSDANYLGGALTVAGALSKGSGSFRIEHPLPSKSATHQLVHSFIEGPKCDLIYRGKVDLVDGKASVNIDTDSTMTEGTFEALCATVQCFTSNESGWGAIRGKVTGNILTIEAQDSASTDNVSWMVIGERKDKHIMDTDWTDKNGRPIVEPLKPVEPALESK